MCGSAVAGIALTGAALTMAVGAITPEEAYRAVNLDTLAHVRFGSEADISACPRDVRFTPKSGHRNSVARLLLRQRCALYGAVIKLHAQSLRPAPTELAQTDHVAWQDHEVDDVRVTAACHRKHVQNRRSLQSEA